MLDADEEPGIHRGRVLEGESVAPFELAALNALEVRIKTKFPEVAWIFVEPDTAD